MSMTALNTPARLLACIVLGLALLPAAARAAVTCTGWGNQQLQYVDLNLPSTVNLPLDAVTGSVLATGSDVFALPLRCIDSVTGKDVTNTDWRLLSMGYDSASDSGIITSALGLKLSVVPATGGGAVDIPSAGGSVNTQGFYWSQVKWTIVRNSNRGSPGNSGVGAVMEAVLTLPDGTNRILSFRGLQDIVTTATCTLSTDKNTVLLPDTDAGELVKNGVSASASLSAYMTCPAFTGATATLTVSTPLAETSDASLVGNSGSAKGVAIEVLDESSKRISASGGTTAAIIRQGTSTAVPGLTRTLGVRMTHLNGQTVSAGTVQGTFTLTLAVN
ncbi:fimbrial protein [Kosakonia sp. H7A]|uniref:fimbrial protein n=1 Tax=Kosakonia sp. H7A TaxID=2054598 RepID=UPI0013047F99